MKKNLRTPAPATLAIASAATEQTTVGYRLDAMLHNIVALEGQLALLEKSDDRDGPGCVSEGEIIACAQRFLTDLWQEWYWLEFNRDTLGGLPAPDQDERDEAEKAGGAR